MWQLDTQQNNEDYVIHCHQKEYLYQYFTSHVSSSPPCKVRDNMHKTILCGLEGLSWDFRLKTETKLSTVSNLVPHLGTNVWDIAKNVPGTIRLILIPQSKKSHFGKKKIANHISCVKIFLNFENQLTFKDLSVSMNLWWSHARFDTHLRVLSIQVLNKN